MKENLEEIVNPNTTFSSLTLVEAAYKFCGRGGGGLIQPPLLICPIELHNSNFWVQGGPMGFQGYIRGLLNCSRFN